MGKHWYRSVRCLVPFLFQASEGRTRGSKSVVTELHPQAGPSRGDSGETMINQRRVAYGCAYNSVGGR